MVSTSGQPPVRSIGELLERARARMPPELWDHSAGGSLTEATLRANRDAFEAVRLRPRILRDVSAVSTATTVVGVPVSLPVLLAPIGSAALFDPQGAAAVARAAEAASVVAAIGVLASPSIEDVAAAHPDARLFFQLYVRGDRDWVERFLRRAERAGYAAVCLTVDSAVEAIRPRDLRNEYDFRAELGASPNLAGMPMDRGYQARLDWDDLHWLRGQTSLPLLLKGVLTPEDAELAVDHGVDAVYVSNHGGRAVDGAVSTLEVLASVVDAVAGRAEVVVDGGFLHGADVVKALALGARAVLVGKLQCWALAAGGAPMLTTAIELLRAEVENTMALLGVADVQELDRACIGPA